MFRLGRANFTNNVEVVFQFCNTHNSFIQHCYCLLNNNVPEPTLNKTVSGLDNNKPINCRFEIITDYAEMIVNRENDERFRNTYVISLFRTDRLYPDLVRQLSVCVVKVSSKRHAEFWYVLGARKVYEYVSGRRYKKILIGGEECTKELIRVRGYMPTDLIQAFNKMKVNSENYLHVLRISEPRTIVDNSRVVVIGSNQDH
ncbi:ORF9 [Agrotis segetum granulovirus]|uniref:Nucleopolyhedrovirus protein DUF884 n=1 Tax=Agrotis segetum granulosis virus TaxID=10464 RepID=Q6QXC8_GVAS|nr:nucleopolyhedrovirus protein DUF884 [Agrotis segetum granulovirus]AAS82729.1 ORF9 [Agrotis segetum granulovirus]AHN92049.1 hypothetical protein AsGV010 [Agrotis segetum granulovirus]AKN63284.1 nucleopolyhedrovirus protein DUF884 [Agrotis segetum granulovirus]